MENEKKVLDWLLEFRDTVDDPDEYVEDSDEIEDVSASVLAKLIEETDSLAVLFCNFSNKNLNVSQLITEYYLQMMTKMQTVWKFSPS